MFNYTDHLGNVRVSYSDIDGNGRLGRELQQYCPPQIDENPPPCEDHIVSAILEENHYYPFGLKHSGYNMDNSQPNYAYKYNGKELQTELGLNMYDMDMRDYDPAIARWIVQDPVVHFDYSPYNAFDNNPIIFSDPSGADSFFHSKFLNRNGGHWSDQYKNNDQDNNSNSSSNNSNVNVYEFAMGVLKNAEMNSASFYLFDKTPKFAAVMDAYNLVMKFSMINEAASIVFGNDSDELRKNLININISMVGVNKVTGDYTSFLWGNVKFDKDYKVIGTGGKDYFINYSTDTSVLKAKKDNYHGKVDGKDFYDNTKTWGLGQDTFTAGHYAVSFSSTKYKGSRGYDINFIGFRTNELRIRYVKYWRAKIDEYVKIFQSKN
ncbi:hypothetical protein SY27_07165 [Flavobacterium sp. 316]|uniref:RHS repeat domain-containing protein n=1 Tax=Flavobacterium sp. 316 TaxID=1603293 RepID=UPI0005E2C805|nr:RHS repeat-associated core domain-containing protein [Flavobacterium sp. 316]KIX21479.1 hypothetical protein SY27_07165 [Flavobacterium sp. 316]